MRVGWIVRLSPVFNADPCDFSTNRVKAGEDDGLRRVIDDQINARQLFNRSNIATFATDDASFHLFVRAQQPDTVASDT